MTVAASTNVTGRTLTEAAAGIRSGEFTSVGLVQEAIAVADEFDSAVGIFIERYQTQALEAAEKADADLAAGKPVGPLHGVPLGIKDIITTVEGKTTAQSLVHDPSSFTGDAVVVERLRAAGGIMMGKLTTMEFAIGAPDASKPFPVPHCSWSLDHWAGGSSSGSGSSVSLGAVYGALGTDTGGSIRIPASFNGISGLMPTFGRVPKSGCVPLGFTLDHIGPMARSARDCATMLDVLAGPAPSDPTTLDVPVPSYTEALTGDLRGLTIGYDRLARISGDKEDSALAEAFEAALDVLRSRGATLKPIELPHYAEMTTADMVIMLGEALAYHLPDLQAAWPDYGAATRAIVSSAIQYSAADYVQAQRARTVGVKAITKLFGEVDLILTPTSGRGATPMSVMATGDVSDWFGTIYTGYWDTTGNPVLSVPFGFSSDGLPLGLQFCGRPFEEALVLKAGDAFQAETDWHRRVPTPMEASV